MQIASAQSFAGSYRPASLSLLGRGATDFAAGGQTPSTRFPAALSGDKLSLSSHILADSSVAGKAAASGSGPQGRLFADIVDKAMKAVMGDNVQSFSPSEVTGTATQVQQTVAVDSVRSGGGRGGFAYDGFRSFYQAETLSFNAKGIVKTKDGQEVEFSVQFDITRELYIERKESLRLGDAMNKTDPLVVEFDGNAADLKDTNFHLGLDVDGRLKQIASMKQGSGLLDFLRQDAERQDAERQDAERQDAERSGQPAPSVSGWFFRNDGYALTQSVDYLV